MTVFSDCAAARIWRWFRENGDMLYRGSVLGRIGSAFSRSWPYSRTGRGWEAFLNRESGAESSLYGRGMAALHRWLMQRGLWLLPVLHRSLAYRAGTALKRSEERRVGKEC